MKRLSNVIKSIPQTLFKCAHPNPADNSITHDQHDDAFSLEIPSCDKMHTGRARTMMLLTQINSALKWIHSLIYSECVCAELDEKSPIKLNQLDLIVPINIVFSHAHRRW